LTGPKIVGITISDAEGEMGTADSTIMRMMSKRRCCRSLPMERGADRG
jgi:hypothetical protein